MLKVNLKMMVFHITPVCDNRCEYCYMGKIKNLNHPPYQHIEKVMVELNNQKVKNILLGGGNPCVYPQLKELIEFGNNMGMNIEIMSNTLEFKDESILEHIKGFDTTILGHDSSSHDAVAGRKGAYYQLVENIRYLTSLGYDVGIALNATPATYNKLFMTIENLINKENIPINKIRYIMIQRIIPQGRARGTLKYSLKPEHLNPMFKDIEKIEDLDLKIVFEDAFPLCLIAEKYHKYLSPCVWGYTKGSINWNGDVSRCGADPRFTVGNIFSKPLSEIWHSSPILLSFRETEWMPEKCKTCPLLEKCRCGCSLSDITKSDHEPDILCSRSLMSIKNH